MEGIIVDYIEVKQKSIELDYDGKKYIIKKPSALKLIEIHDGGKNINVETELKKLVQYQIDVLVDLGLDRIIAESLDISTLKNCFLSLSQDPVKKK